MNNYLMFQKVLKAAYIPPDEQKYNYFRSTVRQVKTKSGKMKWVSSTTASIQPLRGHFWRVCPSWEHKPHLRALDRGAEEPSELEVPVNISGMLIIPATDLGYFQKRHQDRYGH
uniref:Uncharacterized protein n=1 Tax=Glossina palpalis gambiensis TaxID=67801 RepID=A0A1B0ARL2_9MUSC